MDDDANMFYYADEADRMIGIVAFYNDRDISTQVQDALEHTRKEHGVCRL